MRMGGYIVPGSNQRGSKTREVGRVFDPPFRAPRTGTAMGEPTQSSERHLREAFLNQGGSEPRLLQNE
jgi:hypothetical protein